MSKMRDYFKKVIPAIKENYKTLIIFGIITLFVFIADIATKWIAVEMLGPLKPAPEFFGDLVNQSGESVSIIPGFLNFTLLTNNGGAFGLGNGELWSRIVFIIISWVAFIGIFVVLTYLFTKGKKVNLLFLISLAVINGGNIGNLIDRTFYWGTPCGVIDFIDIGPLIKGFGVFNIADAAVICGVALMMISFIVDWINESKEESKKSKNEK